MKKFLIAGLGLVAAAALVAVLWAALVLYDLPDVSILKHYRPAAASEVLDREGRALTQYYDRKFRIWVPISSLPDLVIQAVVTAEDDTFFEHRGVNYRATWDALVHDAQKWRFARGGSTITQQMIKNVLLSREKTISRKLREYVLARRAEDLISKRRILEIYLNEVEWGDGIYGVEAASRYYFDKHASELSVDEAALLAGMLPNPKYYDPYKRKNKARDRQERVLSNMLQAKLITPDGFAAAMEAPLKLREARSGMIDSAALAGGRSRPCYQNVLEKVLLEVAGEQKLYRTGDTIRTTLDRPLQEELARREETIPGPVREVPDQITVVKEGEEIRALSCFSAAETQARLLPGSGDGAVGAPAGEYTVSTVSVDSVTSGQILMTEPADRR
jgi:monofunctional biosynthetic peptidoglycan transglycosylase